VRRREGYTLIAVLIVIVVLTLAAYQFTDVMTAEHRAAARTTDALQARHSAVSGVHYAAAMLADPASFYGDLQGDPTQEGAFESMIVRDGPVPRAQARFALVSVVSNGNGDFEQRFGAVVDESSKLNINALIQLDPSGETLAAALTKLAEATGNPLLTSDLIDAIVDWVDSDEDARTNGAENSYYLGAAGQYKAKNGPLNTLDELLLVRGVTPQLLYGTDRNRNGVADDDAPGGFDRGLADYLTVYGRELNLDAVGAIRENVNESEDMAGLYERLQMRVGNELATFIMAYKTFQNVSTATTTSTTQQQNVQAGSISDLESLVKASLEAGTAVSRRRLKSLLDLRTARITLPRPQNAPADTPTIVVTSPLADPSKLPAMAGTLLDLTTTTTVVEMTPRININTAPREVLMALTGVAGGTGSTGSSAGLTEADVDAIINLRQNQNPADPATLTGAWLLQEGGISADVFKKLEKYVTGRSMVYRVHSIGYFGEGGPTARVEAVVDTNRGAPRILYFRDLTDLDTPRGFEPPR
jgi:type II secretory pathway component PulK